MTSKIILPDFIGVGGHKCASTWLSECMRDHPEICMSNPKETFFFKQHWPKGLEWYSKHWYSCSDNCTKGEFTSLYLYNKESIERIRQTLPHAKIVVVVREPISRSFSQILHGIREGILKSPRKRYIDKNLLKRYIETYPAIINYSKYLNGLNELDRKFGRQQLIVFKQEQLTKEPQECLQALWRFLSVSEDFIPPRAYKTISPGINPRFLFLEYLRLRIYRLARNTPGVVPAVRKTRIAEIYRHLNKGRDLELTEDAKNYVWQICGNDWRQSSSYITEFKDVHGNGSTPAARICPRPQS